MSQRGIQARHALCVTVISLALAACSSTPNPPINSGFGGHQTDGVASWYGPGFHGKKTASGERFNQNAMTAAHKTLPFGTRVYVTNLRNGKTVEVRINDRGPFVKGRIIDLSKAAANKLGMLRDGIVPVRVQILAFGD